MSTKSNGVIRKSAKLLLSAAAAAAVVMLASSCIVTVEDGAKIRYTWESSQQSYIESIAASYRDVDNWYATVWEVYYPNVPLEASHKPKYDGSPQVPNNIYSSTLRNTNYKGTYHSISAGNYTAICTVYDPTFGDTYDIVANYEIKEFYFYIGETTYHELAFDVRRFLSGNDRPDTWFDFDRYENRNEKPILLKAPDSDPVVRVVEDSGVTYIVLRRPVKG